MGALHPRYKHALSALESVEGWTLDGNIQNGHRKKEINVFSRSGPPNSNEKPVQLVRQVLFIPPEPTLHLFSMVFLVLIYVSYLGNTFLQRTVLPFIWYFLMI